jgi:peptidoglycan/LPS O-acetylase OafA/YrhL
LILTASYFFLAELTTYENSIFGFPIISIGYGFLVVGAISPTSFLYQWQSKTTTLMATLSYAIYLSHKGIIHMVQELFSKNGVNKNDNLMLLICIVFCILVAWILHLIIEKPLMKMRNKFIQ